MQQLTWQRFTHNQLLALLTLLNAVRMKAQMPIPCVRSRRGSRRPPDRSGLGLEMPWAWWQERKMCTLIWRKAWQGANKYLVFGTVSVVSEYRSVSYPWRRRQHFAQAFCLNGGI